MSDEAAFLEALKANPADDTTRLVYADWLDEHNEPQKAEYLRAVVELSRWPNVAESERGLQVARCAGDLPANWRLLTAARFVVALGEPDEHAHQYVVGFVRELTRFPLNYILKHLASAARRPLLRTTWEGAMGILWHCPHAAFRIEACGRPDDRQRASHITFALAVCRFPQPNESESQIAEVVAPLTALLSSALNWSPERSANGARGTSPITLVEGIEYPAADACLQRWQSLLPVPGTSELFAPISVHCSSTPIPELGHS